MAQMLLSLVAFSCMLCLSLCGGLRVSEPSKFEGPRRRKLLEVGMVEANARNGLSIFLDRPAYRSGDTVNGFVRVNITQDTSSFVGKTIHHTATLNTVKLMVSATSTAILDNRGEYVEYRDLTGPRVVLPRSDSYQCGGSVPCSYQCGGSVPCPYNNNNNGYPYPNGQPYPCGGSVPCPYNTNNGQPYQCGGSIPCPNNNNGQQYQCRQSVTFVSPPGGAISFQPSTSIDIIPAFTNTLFAPKAQLESNAVMDLPFNFRLPSDAPPSLSLAKGAISYRITTAIDIADRRGTALDYNLLVISNDVSMVKDLQPVDIRRSERGASSVALLESWRAGGEGEVQLHLELRSNMINTDPEAPDGFLTEIEGSIGVLNKAGDDTLTSVVMEVWTSMTSSAMGYQDTDTRSTFSYTLYQGKLAPGGELDLKIKVGPGTLYSSGKYLNHEVKNKLRFTAHLRGSLGLAKESQVEIPLQVGNFRPADSSGG